ncbi:FadR/GntR family transcriptional regulator [Alkalihalophilus lindianensis]|uniref:FadR/GntR family transcriptional regulator n=1 Tax=Alkalihalophilus lindianensis TaxID=1630542 RepID=A0ABU3X6R3_9BACI|nr:FadR/GntR family transcriptional regulator [Alkalihalophilus lindianensis]MDV2682953.1 FadR/GntR family transcriptional regulator [Alkalihalophilus lindianensis]
MNEVQGMAFKQVQTKKVSEVIREQLEEMIREGEVKPGEKLDSVEKLAKEFNVSRSAVREALSALRAVGLITIRQGEGTFVNKYDFSNMFAPVTVERIISKQEMLELFQVRKIIEVGAASLAALYRTEEDLQEMKTALVEMEQAAGNEDLGEKADVKFHLALARATGNSILKDMMQQLSDTLGKTMYESRRIGLFSDKPTFDRLQVEHEAIFEAIENQDANKANEKMLEHLKNVENTLIAYHQDK